LTTVDAGRHLATAVRQRLLRRVLVVDRTVPFYGADPEDLVHRLRRAFDRLSELFADITWHVNPAAPRRG
jgi:hypothetical protein